MDIKEYEIDVDAYLSCISDDIKWGLNLDNPPTLSIIRDGRSMDEREDTPLIRLQYDDIDEIVDGTPFYAWNHIARAGGGSYYSMHIPEIRKKVLKIVEDIITIHYRFLKLDNDIERWKFVRENHNKGITVCCDNDSTYIIVDGIDDEYANFRESIGNSAGVFSLLKAVGIKAECV